MLSVAIPEHFGATGKVHSITTKRESALTTAYRIPCHGRSGGYTVRNLLSIVVIIAILFLAVPLYMTAVADSEKKVCRANMQTIANAVQDSKMKNAYSNYSSFIGSVTTAAEPALQYVPLCFKGGRYTIGKGRYPGGFAVSCSVTAHGSFEAGAYVK